jgi:EAL domain-containing protein (putative c-di-GMP-specific phosphodiesterase class I)
MNFRRVLAAPSALGDPEGRGIVDGVIRMTHALNHHVIAEGVESVRHSDALSEWVRAA